MLRDSLTLLGEVDELGVSYLCVPETEQFSMFQDRKEFCRSGFKNCEVLKGSQEWLGGDGS